ncbi:MAG: Eco29kI family restriction endonuclease [Pseudorhizobium pelagicum]|uniref:Eco29kI family restriction endonuclease n=1 Tax=Pseudorhizobium pelagicum TaxID=1509405 RepID=UPI003460646F
MRFAGRCLDPLGENMLIESFKSIWNRALDGFGNNAPGRNRETQFLSPWDVLHPGRQAFKKAKDSGLTPEFLVKRLEDYFAGRRMKSLPRPIEEQQEADQTEAVDAADNI